MSHRPAPSPPLPGGYVLLPVKTTYLEMNSAPAAPATAAPPGCRAERWRHPGPDGYRALFAAVGGEWGWSGRLILPEPALRSLLRSPGNATFRLFCAGDVAGFAELERRAGQVEIAYFGLLPAFFGRGLGKFFLDWVIRRAWRGDTRRVWLHTCELDHPRALATYRKAGFRPVEEKVELQPYPSRFRKKIFSASG